MRPFLRRPIFAPLPCLIPFPRTRHGLLFLGCVVLFSSAQASPDDAVVTVYSSIHNGYTRNALSDGSVKPETYAFGEGGQYTTEHKDPSIDHLKFSEIARTIAPSLASQNYLPCNTSDPKHTDLLIVIYWGTTLGTDNSSSSAEYQIAHDLTPLPQRPPPPPPNGLNDTGWVSDPSTSGRASEFEQMYAIRMANESAMEQSILITGAGNRQRDLKNLQNAAILGYLPEIERTNVHQHTALRAHRQDIIDDVEESRYYVVLVAYDFPSLLQHKPRKLLWTTRFSIRERHNDFGEQLPSMAKLASTYFGQASSGLIRRPIREGRVELGELKSLGADR